MRALAAEGLARPARDFSVGLWVLRFRVTSGNGAAPGAGGQYKGMRDGERAEHK